MRALKINRECYEKLGYFELMDDIQSIIDTNQHLTKEKKSKRSRNFFSRNAPAPTLN